LSRAHPARTRVTRSLTEEECQRYLQHACPEGGYE